MMVTFVSQCEKKSLAKTRRVLDTFANRIGSNTWQTVITNEGLQAVKTLLRSTASKNTAVSCHWLRSRSRSELVWIVGNRSKFNAQGVVPVNYTQNNNLLMKDGVLWQNVDVIALLAGIAGLFHDFGKANVLFQNKLDPKYKGKNWEPYRHEWVSLRLFQAFVGQQTDEQWLQSLKNVKEEDELIVLNQLVKDPEEGIKNPFSGFPVTAKLVAWLIVSHHKLPTYPSDRASNAPSFEYINQWLDKAFDSLWNSANSLDDWDEQIRVNNWVFPNGTPLLSITWRDKAKSLATRALQCKQLTQRSWFDNRFTAHLSRLVLMLADHYYSASNATVQWQDQRYKCYANTEDGALKQRLDEHNIGVSSNAYLLARKLPSLKANLPTLGYDRKFTQQTKIRKFFWQNKAYNLAKSLSDKSESHGFFGINMASTGLGKTLGNARIMYALSGKSGCRFNVALGLRTLTLQTGDALTERLKLDETELAVLIGSQAVKRLHENSNKDNNAEAKENELKGSESLESLFSKDTHVEYKGALNDGVLSKWLGKNAKLEKLLNAPVLVSTIDYLIPATEGIRGGKQIAPMLRLLTSDLVLDEPDDFGLEDLPALCRLVNWAGVLGSRVLLSTATMPPALAYALFEAYQEGRRDFTSVNGDLGEIDTVCCAWFDEFGCTTTSADDKDKFRKSHSEFVEKRISKLRKDKQAFRKARLIPLACVRPEEALETISGTIHDAIHQLHQEHYQKHATGKKVSIGLVRMANINPLVAVAKELLSNAPQDDFQIHYCVYHSQFPLAVRSHIEQKLDAVLTRHNEDDIWLQKEIKQAIETQPERHHVFVVLATSVAEVGRDHDYDWAIAEPSSMRSLIQLAGRIQRHRKHEPQTENMLILSQNFKALKNITPAYCRPGFETKNRRFSSHNLTDLLKQKNYQQINAIPRIQMPQGKLELEDGEYLDFVQLEQWALFQRLLGAGKEENNARLWWNNQTTWNGELQRIQPFRRSSPDAPYCLYSETASEGIYWTRRDETSMPVTYPETDVIETKDITMADGNQSWLSLEVDDIYLNLANRLGVNMKYVSKVFGELRLREDKDKVIAWCYHPVLGVYCEVDT